MTFKIQRKFLISLANWLGSLELSGPQSRARTKFVTLASEALDRAEKDRRAVLDEYADKDKDGELVKVKDDKGQENFHVADDKMKAFQVEVAAIYDQEAELTAPEFSVSLVIVRNLVLNTETKIGPAIAAQYSEWCDAFEKVTIN